MQDIKLKNMREDYSCIPDYETFSKSEAKAIVRAVKSIYKLEEREDNKDAEEIVKKSISVSAVNEDFSLKILGENLGIEIGSGLFVSWDKFNEIDNIKTDEFELIFTENAKNHIKFSDFPLTIKNACGTEMVGSKRLNRWFIKHKIPLIKRELWPVIYATNGKLIYVAKSSFSSGLNANKITLSVVK